MNPFFLDFESNKAGQFYLAGFGSKGTFEQRVLTDDLQGFANAKSLMTQRPVDFVFEMLERLHDEQLILVAYSRAKMAIINNIFKDGAPTKDFAEDLALIRFSW